MTDITLLTARAGVATRCSASAAEAIRHVRQARLLATESGCSPTTTAALLRAERNLLDARDDADVHRKRLLRKVDRKEKANG